MIQARNEETKRFMETIMEHERQEKLRMKAVKKDKSSMRLACIKYHCDGSTTKIWRHA